MAEYALRAALPRRLQSRIVRGIEHHQALGEARRDGADQAIVVQAQDLERRGARETGGDRSGELVSIEPEVGELLEPAHLFGNRAGQPVVGKQQGTEVRTERGRDRSGEFVVVEEDLFEPRLAEQLRGQRA